MQKPPGLNPAAQTADKPADFFWRVFRLEREGVAAGVDAEKMKKEPAGSRPGHVWFPGECQGDLLHVLAGGCQQALPRYLHEAAEPRITVPVQLFGIRKRALHRLLAPLVDRLAP